MPAGAEAFFRGLRKGAPQGEWFRPCETSQPVAAFPRGPSASFPAGGSDSGAYY
jgi:hypothetical protein